MAGVAMDCAETYRYAVKWLLWKGLRMVNIDDKNTGNNCFYVAVQSAASGHRTDAMTNANVVLRNIPVQVLRQSVYEYADVVWNTVTDIYHDGMKLHLQHEFGDSSPDVDHGALYQRWREGAVGDAMADNVVMELFTHRYRLKMQVFFFLDKKCW
jgi:hypothetical protein